MAATISGRSGVLAAHGKRDSSSHQREQATAFHLMSYAFDEEDGRLFVALNPQIAEAILGRRPYTRIEMAEVRALQTDPARLIHQRLCGWIDPGKAGRVELDTLSGYVWPDDARTLRP